MTEAITKEEAFLAFGNNDNSADKLPLIGGTLTGSLVGTDITLSGIAPSPPIAKTLYTDNIINARVQFDGFTVTSPVALTGVNGSFNVSGILDLGTGNYRIYWIIPFANDNYAAVCMANHNKDSYQAYPALDSDAGGYAVGSITIQLVNNSGTFVDSDFVSCIASGDQ